MTKFVVVESESIIRTYIVEAENEEEADRKTSIIGGDYSKPKNIMKSYDTSVTKIEE